MTFTQSIRTCFSKYLTSAGRASRSEYWWFYLFILLAGIALGIVDGVIFGFGDRDSSPISAVFSLATFIPTIAVTIRRLHDVDRSGWWQIAPIGLVLLTGVLAAMAANILAVAAGVAAVICVVLLIVWLIKRGTIGENRFGYDPLDGPDSQPPSGNSEDQFAPSSIPKIK